MSESNWLDVQLDKCYKEVEKTDYRLYRLNRKQVGDYWELGKIAHQKKRSMKHGEWLPFLEEKGYVERTVQRAIAIYLNFPDDKKLTEGLTLAEAETGETSEEKKKRLEEEERLKKATGNVTKKGQPSAPSVARTTGKKVTGCWRRCWRRCWHEGTYDKSSRYRPVQSFPHRSRLIFHRLLDAA